MMSTSSDSSLEPQKKRTHNPSLYKRNVIRNSKVKGVEYKNHTGKNIPARITGKSCKCKNTCFSQFVEEDFSICIQKINNFSSKDEQDIFLQQLIEKHTVKKKRFRKEGAKPRQASFQYFVIRTEEKVNVCKQAFISMYGITEGRVRRLCILLMAGKSPQDLRGQQPKANTIQPETCREIHEHILCFPRKKTHYSGKNIEYLDARLDVKTMHIMFKKKFPDLNVKYKFYLKYFQENFSLRFGRPQIDTCITCEQLSVKIKSPTLSENAKRASIAEKMVHKRRAKKFYNKISTIKELCQERDDIAAITFDFMQNLPLPNIPIQEIFYLRQLWVNCFGIKNMKNNKSTFYVYHEGNANKGANEICSILLHYINMNFGPNIKQLYIFSDGAPGQNKNNTVVRFLLSLTDTKRFEKINHYFPIRGHSFLPNDRDFGVIKKKIRKHDRIYVPEEYCKIIKEASENFCVVKLQTDQVYDFKKWWTSYYKKSCLSNDSYGKKVAKELKETFSVSSYMNFEYNTKKKGIVQTEEYIDGLSKHTFSFLKNITAKVASPSAKAYPNQRVPINENKIKNLKQVESSIIDEHKPFYQEIFNWPTEQEVDENIESDGEYDYVP